MFPIQTAPPERAEKNILIALGSAAAAPSFQERFLTPRHWRVEFAADASALSSALSRGDLDAAIVDLHLPTLNGNAFLRDLMQRSPHTLRIGVIRPDEKARCAEVPTQQLLAAPCEPRVVQAILARAFASEDFLSNQKLRQLTASLNALPPVPAIFQELMLELRSEDCSLGRVGEIVSRDLALSAKVLQLVNSAFFGLGRTVADPGEAAVFLGSDSLCSLVLSLASFAQFSQSQLRGLKLDTLWQHSWTTGVVARNIAECEDAGAEVARQSLLAGLMHDVGKLVLAIHFPEAWAQIGPQATELGIPPSEQEFRIFEASHAEIGGFLISRWGLPGPVVEAVAFHHRPQLAPNRRFSALTAVHAANALGYQTSPNSGFASPLDLDYLRGLGLGDRVATWQQVCQETCEKAG